MADQLEAIYRPKGEALEYALHGLNLYGGCSHGCIYCYNRFRFHRSLEPVIDPAQTLALVEATHEYVDFYGVGKWNHDTRAKEINWPKFRADAEELLKRHGKAYKIKAALGAVV